MRQEAADKPAGRLATTPAGRSLGLWAALALLLPGPLAFLAGTACVAAQKAPPPPALPADAAAFWAAWGDGRAEVSGYDLRKERYGQGRAGHAVLIYVTEDWNDAARVKADAARPGQTFPVLKLNHVAKFQTGIYDYSLMTSVFARADVAGWPLRKVSFSSQEWCGQVYHQVLPDTPPGHLRSTSHSYFEKEADQTLDLAQPAGALAEDALPLLLRTYPGRPDLLPPGGERSAPLLLSLARARLRHLPLRYARATLRRAAAPAPYTTPAGTSPALTYTIDIGDISDSSSPGVTDQLTYHIEAAPPHRVLGWSARSGEEARLRGTARLPYWQLNRPGGEAALQQLGLVPIAR